MKQGYSNHLEIPRVVEQARAAMHRYGAEADIRVITFYNMQKRDLEREFKMQRDVSHIPIASVSDAPSLRYYFMKKAFRVPCYFEASHI